MREDKPILRLHNKTAFLGDEQNSFPRDFHVPRETVLL